MHRSIHCYGRVTLLPHTSLPLLREYKLVQVMVHIQLLRLRRKYNIIIIVLKYNTINLNKHFPTKENSEYTDRLQ